MSDQPIEQAVLPQEPDPNAAPTADPTAPVAPETPASDAPSQEPADPPHAEGDVVEGVEVAANSTLFALPPTAFGEHGLSSNQMDGAIIELNSETAESPRGHSNTLEVLLGDGSGVEVTPTEV